MQSNRIFYLLLMIVLIYSFLLRINYLGHTFRFADAYRDYLVSRNIVRENKLVMVGPYNGAFGTLSSPIYFYLIAAILKINQNILFLEFILIVLQITSIYVVFLIGKNLFSIQAGILAAILYSFSKIILQQANFIWQPNLMQPVFIFSIYFLLSSYRSKNFNKYIVGIALTVLAMTLYNSVFGMVAALATAYYFIFKKNSWGIKKAAYSFLLASGLFLLLYLPTIAYHLTNQKNIILVSPENLEPSTFLERLPRNVKYLIHLNSYHFGGESSSLVYQDLQPNIMALIVIILIIYYLIDKRIGLSNKLIILLLIFSVFSPVVIASFSKSFIQARHFFLALVPLSLLIGEVTSRKLRNSLLQLPLMIILIVLVVKGFMLNPADFNLGFRTKPNGQLSEQTFKSIRQDILRTRTENNFNSFNFFQFYIYPNTPQINGWSDAEFWVKLEDSFNIRFTRIDDSKLYLSYEVINSDQFVYLVCDKRIIGGLSADGCAEKFFQTSGYQFIRQVVQDSLMSVFLTKKPKLVGLDEKNFNHNIFCIHCL